MPIQITYTQARANLATLLDEVTHNRETVIINRRGADPVAMVSASELSSLEETAYLMRSPKNMKRLLEALKRSESEDLEPQTVESLRQELGLA
jgi:antitoxin YefM